MDLKTFFSKTRAGFVVKNVLLALLAGIVLLVVLLHWLGRYTQHGVEVEVPDVTGLCVEEAVPLLAAEGLRCEVIDSTYSNKVPLGTIVEQTPPADAHAKRDRTVYLIVNARSRRTVVLPDLTDVSYRQAEATLRQMGITVEEMQYEPSEFKDLVLDVRRGSESLPAGTRLEEGSRVVLVVGYGKGTEQVQVPDLRGKTLAEARAILLHSYLTPGMTDYDEPPTDENRDRYVIYSQTPAAGQFLLEGSRVDILLSQDMEKAVTADNTTEDESFF